MSASPQSGPSREVGSVRQLAVVSCCDDLRRCLAHNRPVNDCWDCWPGFLRWLGTLCGREMQKPVEKSQPDQAGKPSEAKT